jgi:tetratricopeptide (TPR) repeat protein
MMTMDYQQYTQRVHQATQLVEAGQYEQAQALFRSLLASDLADQDKAMMCLNLAVVSDKQGQTAEALRWYDAGITYERRHGRYFVAESKAVYLAEQGQVNESLATYEALLTESFVDEVSKERIRQNIRKLRQRSSG